MEDCVFCKIVRGEMGEIAWESDDFAAFKDIHPKAKTHLLVVPKEHYSDLNELVAAGTAHRFLDAVVQLAKAAGVSDAYSMQVNVGPGGGQEVFHLHAHIQSPTATTL